MARAVKLEDLEDGWEPAWARWLAPTSILEATESDVQEFLDGRRLGARGRYVWLSHLHCFYAFAMKQGLAEKDPTALIDRPRLRKLVPRPISDADLVHAIRLAVPQMRAWLILAAFAGLRCAEIAGLERDCVSDSEKVPTLRILGKGQKTRIVQAHPLVVDALRRSGLPRTGLVFRTPTGLPFTPAQVSRVISVYLHSIGIEATAHQLRHWFGSRVYASSGEDILITQYLLGHESVTTTAGYTAFSQVRAGDAVFSLALEGLA